MADGPDETKPSIEDEEEIEEEEYGPTPEERLTRRRRRLWGLAIAVFVGAGIWAGSQVVALLYQRPGVEQTEGVAEVLQWTRIINSAAYGVMLGALVTLGALLLLDVLQRRFTGKPAFARLPGAVESTDETFAPAGEVDEDEDEEREELTEADLTNEELARLLLTERASRRDLRRAVLIGARVALFILALAVVTWTVSSTAAAFVIPFFDPDGNAETYALLQHIGLTALYAGFGMLALLGGALLVHELGRRLTPTD